jgi:hypothetical protein
MARHSRPSANCSPSPRSVRPVLEAFEDRTTPAQIGWINPAGGAWDLASNWDLGRTPQPDDDVVIRSLDYGAVIDHASGSDTVQSISSQIDYAMLAITDVSTLTVAGSVNVANLIADTGGVFTANNDGTLTSNLTAEAAGEIHFPALATYNATVFTRLEATGSGSLIDLPALTSLQATTEPPIPPIPGEVRLDLVADQSGTIHLPALTSVRGHPDDYLVGYTALRASNGGSFLFDPNGSVTFVASGSLAVDAGADVGAADIIIDDGGDLTVDGSLEATFVLVRGYATVTGALTVSGAYTLNGGMTNIEAGTVTVGDVFDIEGGDVFGSGTINGDVNNAGLLIVGALTIDGNYRQTASGQLSVSLRSAGDFDQLVVTGNASLDGTLTITLTHGYQPQEGDEFQVVQFGAGTGTFARIRGASLFGVEYIFQPRTGFQPGVILLF